jgi:hyperosmotically inducible protein
MRNYSPVIVVFTIIAALTIGCQTANNNTNANGNTTAVNANANANTSANINANGNANRPLNANMSRAEYERDKDSWAEEARRLGRTIGTGVNDGWLWTKTRALLASENDLRDTTINVDVENGVITLSGSVATNQQKTTAGRIAQGVNGVAGVRNNLAIAGNTNG